MPASPKPQVVNPRDSHIWRHLTEGEPMHWRVAYKAVQSCIDGAKEQIRFLSILYKMGKILPYANLEDATAHRHSARALRMQALAESDTS